MNWKTWAPLTVAVGLGLVAALSAKQWMARQDENREPGHTKSVVVASHDVAPGTSLSQADLKVSSIPADVAAPGTFAQVSDLVGRVVTTPVAAGQAVVAPFLAPEGNVGGLTALIPDGMRAVTLEISEFSGVGGMLLPGSRVDVLATLRSDQDHDPVTRTVAQNLKVLAVGQSLKSQHSDNAKGTNERTLPRSVTLLATPKQAELMQLATQNARPWLMLRGGEDDTTTSTSGVTLAELRGNPQDAEKQAADSKPTAVVRVEAPTTQPTQVGASTPRMTRQTVQLIRGASESQVIFEMPAKSGASSGTLVSSVAE